MKGQEKSSLAGIIQKNESDILSEWVKDQTSGASRKDKVHEVELQKLSRDFLASMGEAVSAGPDVRAESWGKVRDMLAEMSGSRAQQGYSPTETATFVFSLKKPLFARLRKELAHNPEALADELWSATQMLDQLGLYTTEMFQKSREDVIQRQQRELMELSTPVVELWDGVLALPLIGTLDSGRTQVVMESLLEKIVHSGAALAIIDITGVPTVDTLVAQHLMKTVAAARLMGADCIISGIRPQIAQTIVHLGVDLSAVTTKASLADAFRLALKRTGARIESGPSAAAAAAKPAPASPGD
jgi:rsbT co-antagonist protein RsbR